MYGKNFLFILFDLNKIGKYQRRTPFLHQKCTQSQKVT